MKFPISLDKLGIKNWDDLVFYFPNRYVDESKITKIKDLSPTKLLQLQVDVESIKIVFRPRRNLLVTVSDDSGYVRLRFLHFRQSFKDFFKVGRKIRILGIAKIIKGEFEFIHPKIKDKWLEEDSKSSFFLKEKGKSSKI